MFTNRFLRLLVIVVLVFAIALTVRNTIVQASGTPRLDNSFHTPLMSDYRPLDNTFHTPAMSDYRPVDNSFHTPQMSDYNP